MVLLSYSEDIIKIKEIDKNLIMLCKKQEFVNVIMKNIYTRSKINSLTNKKLLTQKLKNKRKISSKSLLHTQKYVRIAWS